MRNPNPTSWTSDLSWNSFEVKREVAYNSSLDINVDLFAWSKTDILDIDPNYHCHQLSICQDVELITQKKRKMDGERRKAIQEEVANLLVAIE